MKGTEICDDKDEDNGGGDDDGSDGDYKIM